MNHDNGCEFAGFKADPAGGQDLTCRLCQSGTMFCQTRDLDTCGLRRQALKDGSGELVRREVQRCPYSGRREGVLVCKAEQNRGRVACLIQNHECCNTYLREQERERVDKRDQQIDSMILALDKALGALSGSEESERWKKDFRRLAAEYLDWCEGCCAGDDEVGIPPCTFYNPPYVGEDGKQVLGTCWVRERVTEREARK